MQLMATIVAVGGGSLSSGLDWVFFSCRFFLFFWVRGGLGDCSLVIAIDLSKTGYHLTTGFTR